MAEKQFSSSGSSNASDTEESCISSVLKMEAKTPTCKADALPPVDGAAAGVSSASQNKNTATALSLAEGLEMLLQTQRRYVSVYHHRIFTSSFILYMQQIYHSRGLAQVGLSPSCTYY